MLLEGQLFGFLVPESRYFSWLGPTMRMDRSCCWKGGYLAFWCGKVGILVGWANLGIIGHCVLLVVRLFGFLVRESRYFSWCMWSCCRG